MNLSSAVLWKCTTRHEHIVCGGSREQSESIDRERCMEETTGEYEGRKTIHHVTFGVQYYLLSTVTTHSVDVYKYTLEYTTSPKIGSYD